MSYKFDHGSSIQAWQFTGSLSWHISAASGASHRCLLNDQDVRITKRINPQQNMRTPRQWASVLALIAMLWPFDPMADAADLVGPARVIDGDTLAIAGDTIRLAHIDTPEMAQICPNGPAEMRRCGAYTAGRLREWIGDADLHCQLNEIDRYGRFIAECSKQGHDVSTWLVEQGLAMAFRRYSDAMIGEEEKARLSGVGLWQTAFQPPWEFRQQQWQVAEQQTAEGCPIKGNINRKGERIYHTPWGSRNYNRTTIDPSRGERWFCDENEARTAGWRAPVH